MNCPKCKKIIVGNANYCSYCGKKINAAVANKEYDKDDLLLKSYIKEGMHSNILDMALAGNVNAEYIIMSMMLKYGWNVDWKTRVKLEKQIDNPTAAAIIGTWEYWDAVNSKEDRVKERQERGLNLIESAAEDGDPAALYILGMFYLGGTSPRYERNEMKAYKYVKKAVDKKFPSAIYDLGIWYCNGENGVQKDEALGESMLMTGIHYQSFLEQNGNLSETDLSKMLESEAVTKAKELLKTDAKKNIEAEKEKEKFIPGTEEEIRLWNEIYACETQDALEKMMKKIKQNEAKDGDSGIDKQVAIRWIQGCNSLYVQRNKEEEEKKRREKEAERKKRKEEREKNYKESAENIINSCKTDDDYLCAIDKLKALNLPEYFFDEYEELLNEKLKEHFANDLAVVKSSPMKDELIYASIFVIVLWLIVIGLLGWSFHAESGFLLFLGIIAIINALFFSVCLKEYFEKYKQGNATWKYITKFNEKGYHIYWYK